MNGMELREGSGNDAGKTKEDDEFNVVWVVDSSQLPFHRAERYHQFHTVGVGAEAWWVWRSVCVVGVEARRVWVW